MRTLSFPATRDLVLVGGGHTHALVMQKWAMNPLPGARLTLVNPHPTAAYSGMLPGFVAGHYSKDALDIDLVRLAKLAGARLILDAACHLDPMNKKIDLRDRGAIDYDVASIDVGITSAMPNLNGFGKHGVPAKPLDQFAQAWDAIRRGTTSINIAVIGAGVAGAELAMAMAHALSQQNRASTVRLLDRSTALSALPPRSRNRLKAALTANAVTLHEHIAISEVAKGHILLEDGSKIDADFVVGAAGAQPHGWLEHCGLDTQSGYIQVDEHLRTSSDTVFAVGDCAEMTNTPRPKAGVFAVRQAPVLYNNLRATLIGQGGLKPYHPQKDYLKLISLGGKTAFADRAGFWLSGPWLWRLKDRIDQTFMQQFETDTPVTKPNLPWPRTPDLRDVIGDKPTCGGCGSKIGATALRNALAPAGFGDVRDDAAILRTADLTQVMTTDHLRAFWDDPSVMARIAAIHALGDIWAMGATPKSATATIILPKSSPTLAQRSLSDIMAAARDVFETAGGSLIGGHSSFGMEMTIGFTVLGQCDQRPINVSGAQPGDTLILTKPLGTGVIMAAEMQRKAKGQWVANALNQMITPQGVASHRLRTATAMTDVTGFGLAGHLANICEQSHTGAVLDSASIPLMPGALELSAAGIRSSLFPENRAILPDLPSDPLTDLLFDPQTAGGLLATVPANQTQIIADLKSEGIQAVAIGHITDQVGQIVLD